MTLPCYPLQVFYETVIMDRSKNLNIYMCIGLCERPVIEIQIIMPNIRSPIKLQYTWKLEYMTSSSLTGFEGLLKPEGIITTQLQVLNFSQHMPMVITESKKKNIEFASIWQLALMIGRSSSNMDNITSIIQWKFWRAKLKWNA